MSETMLKIQPVQDQTICQGWDPSMIVYVGEPNKICSNKTKYRTILDKTPYCKFHAERSMIGDPMGNDFEDYYEPIPKIPKGDLECGCGRNDKELHLAKRDHRKLEEVGIYCLKCKDWCTNI